MFDTISVYFLYFLAYSIFGWAWEVFLSFVREHRFVNRGFLNGPYCPIYGAGALLFIQFQHFTDRPVELFFGGAVAACIMEYIVSVALEKAFKARWWDYSQYPMNLNGRICLYGFIVFGIFSAVMPHVQGVVAGYINSWPIDLRRAISATAMVLFIVDLCATTSALAKFNEVLRKYQKHFKLPLFIEQKLNQGRQIFSFQQIRIMKAFPDFISIPYAESMKRLRQLNAKARAQFKKDKFQPTPPPKKKKH